MGSHSVTCHPADLTFPPLPQSKLALDFCNPRWIQGWVGLDTAVGAQPMPKSAYRSGCRDKHNRPRWDSNLGPLMPQSDALTSRPLRPAVMSLCLWSLYLRWFNIPSMLRSLPRSASLSDPRGGVGSYWNTATEATAAFSAPFFVRELKEGRISLYYHTFPQWMVFANFVTSCNTQLSLVNKDWYFVYTPVPIPSVSYVMVLVVVFSLFVFMLALLCFCVAAVFSVNKDLYKSFYLRHGGFFSWSPQTGPICAPLWSQTRGLFS